MAEERNQQLTGFGIANYRSFDEEGFVIERLNKINVFIGKNNSGKSNILRTIRLLKRVDSPKMPPGKTTDRRKGLELEPEIDSHNRTGTPPSLTVYLSPETLVLENEYLIRQIQNLDERVRIRWNAVTGAVESFTALDAMSGDNLLSVHDILTGRRYTRTPTRENVISAIGLALVERAISALREFDKLICVENFREIRGAANTQQDADTFNGLNVIALLREMQVPLIGKESQGRVFETINRFVGDLLGDSNLQLAVPVREDVIYVTMHGRRLPLDSYGTGVHQLVILCAALAMHTDHVVCIEEPEIHIHPDLQRKFLRFIAHETDNRYFITTHSNVYLDLLDDVGIYHVTHDGIRSTGAPVSAEPSARELLADLGYKASDLLQANCLLWVEGPSDRVYINKWIELTAPDLKEGIHYAITFYGGRVLAHFTGVNQPEHDLVEVLRINQHSIFVMDRDEVKADGKLNTTKERVRAEFGDEQCWVTQGREIENYLRPALVRAFLSQELGKPITFTCRKDMHLQKAIDKATKGAGRRIAYDKVTYARCFADRMTSEDLDVLDLRKWVEQIVRLIREWN